MSAKDNYLTLKLTLVAKIQTDLEEVAAKHKIWKKCDNKEALFILSKFIKVTIHILTAFGKL